jgi:hypothetical protein
MISIKLLLKNYIKTLQKASSKKPEYLQAADNYLQGLMMGFQEAEGSKTGDVGRTKKGVTKKKPGRDQEPESLLDK